MDGFGLNYTVQNTHYSKKKNINTTGDSEEEEYFMSCVVSTQFQH